MESKAINLGLTTEGRSFLADVARDFGGRRSARLAQRAATSYLRDLDESKARRNKQNKTMTLLAGLSALAASTILNTCQGENKTTDSGNTKGSQPNTDCIVEVNAGKGLGSAWDIAKVVSPAGKLGIVFPELRSQAQGRENGYLHDGDILIVPKIACDNQVTRPLDQTPSE